MIYVHLRTTHPRLTDGTFRNLHALVQWWFVTLCAGLEATDQIGRFLRARSATAGA